MLCAITIKNEKKSIFGVKFSARWKKFQEANLKYHLKKTKTLLIRRRQLADATNFQQKNGLLIAQNLV